MSLITLSGIDGSGKTSLATRVVELVELRSGRHASVARPNYRNSFIIRNYCALRYNDEYAYFPALDPDFYISSLALDWLDWWMTAFMPENPNHVFVCDRYITDVYAQALRYGAKIESFGQIFAPMPTPSAAFFLNIDPHHAAARIGRRGHGGHRLESEAELVGLARTFAPALSLVKWHTHELDATADVNEQAERIWAHIHDLF